MEKMVIAVCGKGGVGKTVFATLLSRALIDASIRPLLIDADPMGGLTGAIGEGPIHSLSAIRDRLIASARKGEAADVAHQLEYLLLEALVERDDYSLLAMGRSAEKGCFCPANDLLRSSIDLFVAKFSFVLIDAEAGIEQINRDVTRHVTKIIGILDGSQRSIDTVRQIVKMVIPIRVSVVANRLSMKEMRQLPGDLELLGSIPENEAVRQFDREGRSLWELPADNEAVLAMRGIALAIGGAESCFSTARSGVARKPRL
jgi:CO dehydrogenase maturation factor